MIPLEKEFDNVMRGIYSKTKSETGYSPKILRNMLNEESGLQVAKQLINAPKPSIGYTTLWEKGRLDLTIEAIVFDNSKWHGLFTSKELEKARKRLESYGYKFRPSKE